MKSTKHLIEFNQKYNLDANIWTGGHDYDCPDDCFSYSFYRLEKIDHAIGEAICSKLGGYKEGCMYEKEGIGYYCSLSQPKHIHKYHFHDWYPTKQDELCWQKHLPWKSIRYDFSHHLYSTTPLFDRYWVYHIDEIEENYPTHFEKAKNIVLQEIKRLANIAKTKNYKSGWVYHKFRDFANTRKKYFNQTIFGDTKFYACPVLFFNKFSPNIVSFSTIEIKEMREREYLEDF